MCIGNRIKEQRKKKGLSQKDLAEKSGISFMSIRRYESDERVASFKALKRIADALDIPLSSLLPMDDLILSARRTDKEKNEAEIAAEKVRDARRAEMLSNYDSLKDEWQCDADAYIKGLCADSSHIREYYADEIWPDVKKNDE